MESAILQELEMLNNALHLQIAAAILIAYHAGHIDHGTFTEIQTQHFKLQEDLRSQRKGRYSDIVLSFTQPQ